MKVVVLLCVLIIVSADPTIFFKETFEDGGKAVYFNYCNIIYIYNVHIIIYILYILLYRRLEREMDTVNTQIRLWRL